MHADLVINDRQSDQGPVVLADLTQLPMLELPLDEAEKILAAGGANREHLDLGAVFSCNSCSQPSMARIASGCRTSGPCRRCNPGWPEHRLATRGWLDPKAGAASSAAPWPRRWNYHASVVFPKASRSACKAQYSGQPGRPCDCSSARMPGSELTSWPSRFP